MDKKNIKTKRTFVPQTIGDSIKKIKRNFSSNFGKTELIIQSKWSEIVGSYFLEFSEPKYINRLPDYENEMGEMVYKNILNVNVDPSAALEFQHFKDTIIEKINSYFGYRAIFDLRIQQRQISSTTYKNKEKINKKQLTDDEQKIILDEVKDLNSRDLKKSLFDLGKNITKYSK